MSTDKKMKIHFAPLQGFTDYAYRNAHSDIFGGIEAYYTPFVRIERGDFRSRELRDINPENNTISNLVPQLIASTPEELKKICNKFIELGYKKADINMGCPFPLIANHYKGSGVLPFPEKVKALLDAASEITELEFSLKLRLGWENPEECLQIAQIINEAKLTQVCLHARIGKQQYKGEVDMDGFKAFYEVCKHPLLYNGDITTVEDIERIASLYPNLSGIMIGRGLLSNPALAKEYATGCATPVETKKRQMRALHQALFDAYSEYLQGDKQILSKMKPFWEYLSDDLVKKTRKKIEKANRISAYEAAVSEAFSQWGKAREIASDDDSEE